MFLKFCVRDLPSLMLLAHFHEYELMHLVFQEIILCDLILFLSLLQFWLICFIGILCACVHMLLFFLRSIVSDITRCFRIPLYIFFNFKP